MVEQVTRDMIPTHWQRQVGIDSQRRGSRPIFKKQLQMVAKLKYTSRARSTCYLSGEDYLLFLGYAAIVLEEWGIVTERELVQCYRRNVNFHVPSTFLERGRCGWKVV